jgi:hypothetical protein
MSSRATQMKEKRVHLSQSAWGPQPSFAAMTSVVVPYSSVPQICDASGSAGHHLRVDSLVDSHTAPSRSSAWRTSQRHPPRE